MVGGLPMIQVFLQLVVVQCIPLFLWRESRMDHAKAPCRYDDTMRSLRLLSWKYVGTSTSNRQGMACPWMNGKGLCFRFCGWSDDFQNGFSTVKYKIQYDIPSFFLNFSKVHLTHVLIHTFCYIQYNNISSFEITHHTTCTRGSVSDRHTCDMPKSGSRKTIE